MTLTTRFDTTLLRPPVLGGPSDPALNQRLRAWCLAGPTFAAQRLANGPVLDAFACELDGSARLQRLGRWQGLAWRLQVKLTDLVPGRLPQPQDPWDCGWLRPEALARLADWQPRRATLILTEQPDAQALLQRALRKPVRLLVVERA